MIFYTNDGQNTFYADKEFELLILGYKWWPHKSGNKTYIRGRNHHKAPMIYLHRLILDVKDSKMDVDHINHNGLDNRLCNIRIVDRTHNNHNRRNVTGCYQESSGRWRAEIIYKKIRYRLGRFNSKVEAMEAYRIKKDELLQLKMK